MVVWFGVDELTAQANGRNDLAAELAEIEETAAGMKSLEALAAAGQEGLARLEARAISAESLPSFRGRIVELAREAGCQIRQVRVGPEREAPWRVGENPLDPADKKPEAADTGFLVRSHDLTLSVSGRTAGVKEFLRHLANLDRLVHTRQMSVTATGSGEKEVILELSLQLFDLSRRTPAG